MYPKFIEVHDKKGILVSINIDHIVAFADNFILLSNKDPKGLSIATRETYDELKQLIWDAGCHIAKKDPRIDDRPLTMEDLKEMIGEPVWNSNSRKWGLVRNYIEAEPGGTDVAFVLDAGDNNIPMTAADLLAKPLYRIHHGE